MSYWVHLERDGVCVEVASHEEGGTYALGGMDVADLNVTYNYSECYRLCGFSIRDLHERRAGDTVTMLEQVVAFLGDRPYTADHWAPTPGNAGHAAAVLLAWARQHPDAVWEVL